MNKALYINTLRTLAIDMVETAQSGHPGLPLEAAALVYILWTKFLKHNPRNPKWSARDRFILSAGHGSALLYSLLHLTGYKVSLQDLKQFRQLGSKTPGHPEYGLTPGVEVTTGPLGQGFANGVGMAIAQKHLAAKFNTEDFSLFDNMIYGLVSDGDIMEGVTAEAASLAGHLKLGNIVYIYLDNKITIEGKTELAFSENVAARFIAYGWDVQKTEGYDLKQIEKTIANAKKEKSKPSLIIARTNIGCGSPQWHDTPRVHGTPLGAEELMATKKNIGWPYPEKRFVVPKNVYDHFDAVKKGLTLEDKWKGALQKYKKKYPEKYTLYKKYQKTTILVQKCIAKFEKPIATRTASGLVINEIAEQIPQLIGGSADLSPSTNTDIKKETSFSAKNYLGRNIHFGIREHAMGAVLNGMALSGQLIPYGGTFLVFSDYMRPAIRLAALMRQRAIYVFTHDSIGLGEDGPTHQPVEQLMALRAIPNLTVIRPADAYETVFAWEEAIKKKNGPTALILSRQTLPLITCGKASNVHKGAYVLSAISKKVQARIVATGSEVSLALDVQKILIENDLGVDIVSMPSWELFEKQTKVYQEKVLPKSMPVISIEMGVAQGWEKYADFHICIENFGASAPLKDITKKYGFEPAAVAKKIKAYLK